MKLAAFLTICIAVAFGPRLEAQMDLDTPSGPITIQALVDGPSELHVKAEGIYWVNMEHAKPGRHDGERYPTYVNGEAWTPLWHKERQDRGDDTSFTHVIPSSRLNYDMKLISVGRSKEDTGIIPRTPIEVRNTDTEYIVLIPDPEPGAMWYKFVLTPRKSP